MSERDVRLNLLFAFPYAGNLKNEGFRAQLVEREQDLRLLFDSGAFTAWRSGKPIALDDYCRGIESLPVQPWRYFVLDVIGDPAGTMRNFEVMLARGFKPIPIFTRGEDISVLDDYFSSADIVGIGGLVGTKGNRAFLNAVMKRAGARHVHWLGFTRHEYLKFYRPYMCDSSRWENGARYGNFELHVGSQPPLNISKTEFATQPEQRVLDSLAALGFNPYQLRERSAWHGWNSVIRKICAANAVLRSLDVERNLGTKIFSAINRGLHMAMFLDAYDRLADNSALAA
jgi:hypothetical protein